MGLFEDGLSPENGLSVTWENDDKSIFRHIHIYIS